METDPYLAHHEGLAQIHQALLGAVRAVAQADAATPLAEFIPRAQGVGRFLLAHHHVEDTVLFPALRRFGQLRSADVAFLEARDREHHEVHALCDRLLAAAGAPHPLVLDVSRIGADILAVLEPHMTTEEAGLAPENLRLMISLEGLEAIGRETEALRQRYQAQRG